MKITKTIFQNTNRKVWYLYRNGYNYGQRTSFQLALDHITDLSYIKKESIKTNLDYITGRDEFNNHFEAKLEPLK